MSRSFYLFCELLEILLDQNLHTCRELAYRLEISKNTVNKQLIEMQHRGFIEIRHGRYGGVRWIKKITQQD